MKKMYHHKNPDGSIDFIGWDTEKKIYSQDYYANVGLCNAEESKHVGSKMVREFTIGCIKLNYKKVTYLEQEKGEDHD